MQATRTALETRLAVQKLNALPPMSLVAQELLTAIGNNELDLSQIAAIIEKDPVLLARLIGLANSAYFGYPERVFSAEDAIFKVLGLNTARNLALSLVLSGPFKTSHCPAFRLDDYWSTAMVSAALAQRLSRLVSLQPRPHAGNAYLAGLLHSLGLLALVHLYPDEMGGALTRGSQGSSALLEQEMALLGADHAEVGGWLARKWHLPSFVVVAIEHYLDPAYRGEHWPTVKLIGFCARWAALTQEENAALDLGVLAELGIAAPEAEKVLDEMLRKREEIAALAHIMASD